MKLWDVHNITTPKNMDYIKDIFIQPGPLKNLMIMHCVNIFYPGYWHCVPARNLLLQDLDFLSVPLGYPPQDRTDLLSHISERE